MPEKPTPEKEPKKYPDPPKWLRSFRKRVSLFDVAYKAFDPRFSDADIRKMLQEAAKDMEGIEMPGLQS